MRDRLFQNIHVVNAMPSANQPAYEDLFIDGQATDVVNLDKYDRATWILQKAAGSTGTAVLTVESCDNVTPSTTTAIAFDYWTCTSGDTWSDKSTATTAGFTTTAGADQLYAIEINSSELSSTDKYARLKITAGTTGGVDGTVTCILSGGRYMQEIPKTAIV